MGHSEFQISTGSDEASCRRAVSPACCCTAGGSAATAAAGDVPSGATTVDVDSAQLSCSASTHGTSALLSSRSVAETATCSSATIDELLASKRSPPVNVTDDRSSRDGEDGCASARGVERQVSPLPLLAVPAAAAMAANAACSHAALVSPSLITVVVAAPALAAAKATSVTAIRSSNADDGRKPSATTMAATALPVPPVADKLLAATGVAAVLQGGESTRGGRATSDNRTLGTPAGRGALAGICRMRSRDGGAGSTPGKLDAFAASADGSGSRCDGNCEGAAVADPLPLTDDDADTDGDGDGDAEELPELDGDGDSDGVMLGVADELAVILALGLPVADDDADELQLALPVLDREGLPVAEMLRVALLLPETDGDSEELAVTEALSLVDGVTVAVAEEVAAVDHVILTEPWSGFKAAVSTGDSPLTKPLPPPPPE